MVTGDLRALPGVAVELAPGGSHSGPTTEKAVSDMKDPKKQVAKYMSRVLACSCLLILFPLATASAQSDRSEGQANGDSAATKSPHLDVWPSPEQFDFVDENSDGSPAYGLSDP